MNSDQKLDRKLRELRDQVAHAPSLVDEVMRRVRETSIAPAPPVPTWRQRLMHATHFKQLRWAVPAAIAAAIVLVVGIWPHDGHNGKSGGPGRVYAIGDVPALLQSARTLHVKCAVYQRDPAQPDKEPLRAEGEYWLDLENGRSRKCRKDNEDPPELGFQYTVCDGQYVMEEYVAKIARGGHSLGVRFKKLTPYQTLLETRQADMLSQLFGEVDRMTGFAITAQEKIGGDLFNVWQGTVQVGPQTVGLEVWLSPTTGHLARVQQWDEHADGSPWLMKMEFEQIERDVPLADELFSTEPRPGFKLENTKETAPTQVLGGGTDVAGVMPYALHRHIDFRLPDGSILLAWGVWDKATPDPEPLFSRLSPGGDLPQLPARPVRLHPAPAQDDLVYHGRHLGYTRFRKDYCVEWALYVPDRTPTAAPILTYSCDVEFTADKDKFGCWFEGLGATIRINSAEDFESWVRGAMADLSESGTAPEHLTFDYTLSLCRQIRSELETARPSDGCSAVERR